MSAQAPPQINIQQLLGPLLMSAVLKGEDVSPIIDALVSSQINEMLMEQMLRSIPIPEEWKPLVDTLKMLAQFDSLRCALAAIRGEECKPSLSFDKMLDIVFGIYLISMFQRTGAGAGAAG